MAGDDLLRKGHESAKAQAEAARKQGDAVAQDRAYMEGRILEFVQALDRFLRLISEHGNPGLETFTTRRHPTFTQIERTLGRRKWRAVRAWALGPRPYLHRVVTPSGQFVSFHSDGWVDAARFIRAEIAGGERLAWDSYREVNKRRTVNFIGTPPPGIGTGEPWRASVDRVIESRAAELGALLHQRGIDID